MSLFYVYKINVLIWSSNIFNQQDKNLQFTFKVQKNNQINFLD